MQRSHRKLLQHPPQPRSVQPLKVFLFSECILPQLAMRTVVSCCVQVGYDSPNRPWDLWFCDRCDMMQTYRFSCCACSACSLPSVYFTKHREAMQVVSNSSLPKMKTTRFTLVEYSLNPLFHHFRGSKICRVSGQACHQPHQPGFEATCGFAMGCTILGTFGIASDTSPIGRWTSTSAESFFRWRATKGEHFPDFKNGTPPS